MENVEASMYCPTWIYYYVGWRKLLARVWLPYPVIRIELSSLFLFKKYLKQEKHRAFYKVGEKTICSFENYAFLEKNPVEVGQTRDSQSTDPEDGSDTAT